MTTPPLPARIGKKLFTRSEHQRWERQAASDAIEAAQRLESQRQARSTVGNKGLI